MSKLYGAARTASEYIRKRFSRQTRDADAQISNQQTSDYVRSRKDLADRLAAFVLGRDGSGDDRKPPDPDQELGPGDFELLGRDASYDRADWYVVMDQMRLTPGSSNVYGYYFETESRKQGILYVTFLASYRGEVRQGPGTTYAYYDVPVKKFREFQRATASSAGSAVWDYLRLRGTTWGHQHQYRLVQAHGEYVPRKATRGGFKTRNVPEIGETGRRTYRRSTLPESTFPDRGYPDRGEPDRGEPDRGR
jgi:hypothetical protein